MALYRVCHETEWGEQRHAVQAYTTPAAAPSTRAHTHTLSLSLPLSQPRAHGRTHTPLAIEAVQSHDPRLSPLGLEATSPNFVSERPHCYKYKISLRIILMFRILVSCGKGWADPENPVPNERKEKKSTELPVEEAEKPNSTHRYWNAYSA